MKRILKVAAIGLVALIALGGAAYTVAIRNHAPTHPVLADAALPKLIPVRNFFADTSSSWSFGTSAKGGYLAHFESRRTKDTLVITKTEPGKAIGKELFALTGINWYLWSGSREEIQVKREGRLWRIDPENPDQDNWLDVTPRGFSRWNIANMPADPDALWIISSNDRNPALADLYTTRQDGGGKELYIQNEGKTLYWHLDKDNTPVVRVDRDPETDNKQILVPGTSADTSQTDAQEWRILDEIDAHDTFHIVEKIPGEDAIIALSSRGRDKAALVRVALSDGAETVLFQDDHVDIDRFINIDPHDGVLDAVLSNAPGAPITPFTPRGETFAKLIAEAGGGAPVDIDGWREAGIDGHMGLAVSPDAKGYEYYSFDLTSGTSTKVETHAFRARYEDILAPTSEIMIPARDGRMLPSLLMRPLGVDGPVPLVVDVHGGPALKYRWQYHRLRQFLVNRGYAVLAVNYRGSRGFGKEFQAAGYGQPGKAMQTDVYDAALWAAEQGIADRENMAIMGGSYGGYSAALAATDPDSPFKVAVIEHAVLDVEYQNRNNPFAWGLNLGQFARYFGDIESDADLKTMREISPQTHVERMNGPVLVVAGKRDRIVGFEQSEEFIKAATAAGKDVETLIFEEAGHGLHRWQDRVIHARALEDFLANHLGGPSGGWDAAQVAAEWLD